MTLRPDWTGVEAWLAEARRWSRAPQRGGMMQHHGTGAHVGGGLRMTFAPGGYRKGRPSRYERDKGTDDAVVILEHHYTIDVSDLPFEEWGQYKSPPFTDDEWATILKMVEAAGFEIVNTWNGPGLSTGSIQLAAGTCTRSVTDLVHRYRQSCPEHGHPFCGPGATVERERSCTWWSAGTAKTISPDWPVVVLPAPGGPEPSIGNRNLEQVLAAIAAAAPFLDDLGVHAAQIVPGRRGRVEGDEYVDEEGLAVAVPAETFTTLMELARLGFELS